MKIVAPEQFGDTDPYKDEVVAAVLAYRRPSARSLQRELGPSDISTPCMRKIALRLLDAPRNDAYCPMPAELGTAGHAFIAEALEADNVKLGYTRWHCEMPVAISTNIKGTADLYDADAKRVVDHKFIGQTNYPKYRKQMNEPYRRQTQLYALGLTRMGYLVEHVCVLLINRGGTLRHSHLWSEPFDQSFAESVLANYRKAVELLNDFDVERNPDRIGWIPATADQCKFCPFHSTNPTSPLQCCGVKDLPRSAEERESVTRRKSK